MPFHIHINLLWVIGVVVVLLSVISRDGDWFDFLDSHTRYENRCANAEFEGMIWIFWIVVAAVVIFALVR